MFAIVGFELIYCFWVIDEEFNMNRESQKKDSFYNQIKNITLDVDDVQKIKYILNELI